MFVCWLATYKSKGARGSGDHNTYTRVFSVAEAETLESHVVHVWVLKSAYYAFRRSKRNDKVLRQIAMLGETGSFGGKVFSEEKVRDQIPTNVD